MLLRDAQGLRPQRLQDPARPQSHHPRADAGRERHAAIPIRQEGAVMAMHAHIGTPVSRVDGRAKVTGAAKYAGEFKASDLAYGYVVDIRHREGPHHAHRRERGVARRGRHRRADARASPAHGGHDARLSGRRCAGRLAVPAALRRQDHVRRAAGRAGGGRGLRDRALRRDLGARRIQGGGAYDRPACRAAECGRPDVPGQIARQVRQGLRGGRCAARGRVLHPDRASQSDGAVRLHGGVGRGRQAHRLRQDAGRAERAALSLLRVQHETGRPARGLAIRRRRVWLGLASDPSGDAGGAGRARAGALGTRRADAPADVHAWLPAGLDRTHCARRHVGRHARCGPPRADRDDLAI